MIRPLQIADTGQALRLLRERPIHNLFLDYLVSAGVLGRVPGFWGCFDGADLRAMLMIGPLGGTSLECRCEEAFEPLARAAAQAPVRPRHVVGDERVTAPFCRALDPWAAALRWSRREPLYLVTRSRLRAPEGPSDLRLGIALEADLDEVVCNSAQQHREDLGDDRQAADPAGFRERHLRDLRDGRWWVARRRGRILFQVHVGVDNAHAIQLGGVFTVPEARGEGVARSSLARLVERLLERRPAVTLFCDESNAPARRAYESIGFEVEFHYRSYLYAEALPRAHTGRG